MNSSLASVREYYWFYFNILLNLFILCNLLKTLKYQWNQNNLKKKKTTHTDKTSPLAEVILYKIHCQITSFCYSVIQLGTILMILSDLKGHYTSSLHDREGERKGEQCTTIWKRRERNAEVICWILVQCELLLRGFYLLIYYWKELMHTWLFSRVSRISLLCHHRSRKQTEGKHPTQSQLSKNRVSKLCVFFSFLRCMNT